MRRDWRAPPTQVKTSPRDSRHRGSRVGLGQQKTKEKQGTGWDVTPSVALRRLGEGPRMQAYLDQGSGGALQPWGATQGVLGLRTKALDSDKSDSGPGSVTDRGGPSVASGACQKVQIFYHSAMSANDS